MTAASQDEWRRALRVYLVVMLAGNLAWEMLQLPLYTIWKTGTRAEQAFAVVHCTGGDMIIATCALVVALVAVGSGRPAQHTARICVALVAIPLGVTYTIYSEWLHVSVRRSWAYAELMPQLPWIGTGLSPLLQWIVVPSIAFRLSTGRYTRELT